MTPHETELTLQSALRGEQTSYRRLFEEYSGGVYTTVVRLTGKNEVAEELTQDVFLRAFNALQSFDSQRGTFYTWIQRIAYNTAISYLRQKKPPEAETIDLELDRLDEPPPEYLHESFSEKDESKIERLLRAIESLPTTEQHLLTLYYFEERSLQEISYIIGISTAALSSRLSRIRKKLYHKLSA